MDRSGVSHVFDVNGWKSRAESQQADRGEPYHLGRYVRRPVQQGDARRRGKSAGSEAHLPPQNPAVQPEPTWPEDHVYCHFHMARINAQLVRPILGNSKVCDRQQLLWAFLLRSIQTLLYIHSCTLLYCLHNRSSCRFFFKWRQQLQQQYDMDTERVALQRSYEDDDGWVVPHNLYAAAFSPSTINVLAFDPEYGADQARLYACKYCGKPEPWYFLMTQTAGGEANPVKRFLQSRNVGMCLCQHRLLGYHVVHSTKATVFLWPQFTVPGSNRVERSSEHLENNKVYPDPKYYLNLVQKYFFRSKGFESHLRKKSLCQ